MKLSKFLKTTIVGAMVMGLSVSLPWAFCDSSIETYALFQCADLAYFAATPTGHTADDLSKVYWQIGFGNNIRNNGLGSDGTGNSGSKATTFNGNDVGIRTFDVVDANSTFPGTGFPAGTVCMGGNNWANAGVDGCCDNNRSALGVSYDNYYSYYYYSSTLYGYYFYGPYSSDDNILNPYFGQYAQATGYLGIYSLFGQQDYPTAVLLKTPGDGHFALAAVTNQDRNNTGGWGDCGNTPPYVGTNKAPCDIGKGFYTWANISNGLTNAINSLPNVVPWQQVLPVPAGTGPTTVTWNAAFFNHDGTSKKTNNPWMDAANPYAAIEDPTRAAGVGMLDLQKKWAGLIRYDLEVATGIADGGGLPDWTAMSTTWTTAVDLSSVPLAGIVGPLDGNGNPSGPVTVSTNVTAGNCYRVHTYVGKKPEGTPAGKANTRLGKSGDVGYEVVPFGPHGVKCVYGGALTSETIQNPGLNRGKGRYRLTWETSGEITVTGFEIMGVTAKGPRLIRNVNCSECSSGLGANYDIGLTPKEVKGGVRAFQIRMLGGNGTVAEIPVR
jgi:hypothetical protein